MVSRNILLLAAALQVPVTVWLQGCKSDKKKNDGGDSEGSGTGGGDGGDGSGSGDESPNKPQTIDELKLHKIDIKATMEAIRKAGNDVVEFRTDDRIYGNPKKVTGTMVPVLPLDFADTAAQNSRKSNFALPGMKHEEFVEEFFLEYSTTSSRKIGRAKNHRFPFSVDPEEFTPLTQLAPEHHVINARGVFQKASAETYIVTGVEPEKRHAKAKLDYSVVTEVYSCWEEGNQAFPRGKPMNLATTLMPLSTDLEFWYYICQRAFSQICFLNASIRSQVDSAQDELYNKMAPGTKKDAVQLDIWTHLEDTREKKDQGAAASDEKDIIDTQDGSDLPRSDNKNKDFIAEGQKAIQELANKIRAHVRARWTSQFSQGKYPEPSDQWKIDYPGYISDGTNTAPTTFVFLNQFQNTPTYTDFSSWKREKWNIDDPSHFEQMMQMIMHLDGPNRGIIPMWIELFQYVKLFYKKHDKISLPLNKEIKKAEKARALFPSVDKYGIVTADQGVQCPAGYTAPQSLEPKFANHALTAGEALAFSTATGQAVVAGQSVDMFTAAHFGVIRETTYNGVNNEDGARTICIPNGLYAAIMRPKQYAQVVPEANGCWDEFEEKMNDKFRGDIRIDSKEIVYYAPRLDGKDSLQDYLVEELVILFAAKAHEHINAVTMLAFWTAREQAMETHYQTARANRMHTSGILAPSNQKEWDPDSRQNKYNRGKYMPYTIDTASWHADYTPQKLIFLKLKSQSGKSFEDIAVEYSKEEVDLSEKVEVQENSELLFVPAPMNEGVHKARFAEE